MRVPYMQSDRDFEMTHEGVEYVVTMRSDARTGHSWIVAIENADTGQPVSREMIERDGATMRQVYRVVESSEWADIHQAAVVAMAKEIDAHH